MRTERAMLHNLTLVAVVTLVLLMTAGVTLAADLKKPNILIIWGDDIGYWNVSAYNQGMMGYKTPNIDRIAREGALFTDWYGQQSCTAGRSCFITGQSGFRTGLLKVGLPGAKEGLLRAMSPSPTCSRRRATSPGSSARTTLATATNIYPLRTASANSTDRFTTLTLSRSRRTQTISKTRRCEKNMQRAVCFIPGRTRT